ncbi:MAG: phage tail protein I, partial [Desulfovibrio sp. S3730MH75]
MNKTLLPSNASQLEIDFSETVARIGDVPVEISTLWNPDSCPLNLLPYLAWALSVDLWDDEWPEDVKRDVIRQSVAIHRVKGTPGAVEMMCKALGYDVRVLEWFEYGGGHDRYKLQVKERMQDEDYQRIVTGDRVAKRQSQ